MKMKAKSQKPAPKSSANKEKESKAKPQAKAKVIPKPAAISKRPVYEEKKAKVASKIPQKSSSVPVQKAKEQTGVKQKQKVPPKVAKKAEVRKESVREDKKREKPSEKEQKARQQKEKAAEKVVAQIDKKPVQKEKSVEPRKETKKHVQEVKMPAQEVKKTLQEAKKLVQAVQKPQQEVKKPISDNKDTKKPFQKEKMPAQEKLPPLKAWSKQEEEEKEPLAKALAQQADVDMNSDVSFEKGTYIAFVDPTDHQDQYKIGRLLSDMREHDKEVSVELFEECEPFKFRHSQEKFPVFDTWIVCDVVVTELPKAFKQKRQELVVTKQQENRVLKLMHWVGKTVEFFKYNLRHGNRDIVDKLLKAQEGYDGSESFDEEEWVDDDDDQEQSEEISHTEEVPIKKAAGRKGKEKAKKKRSQKNGEDEEMKDEEEVQIDTSKKRAQDDTPKVGAKRKRSSKNEEEKAAKKRKVAKEGPKETFKKGKWNPKIVLLEEDKYLESGSSEPFFDCCMRCNNKNVTRAAFTKNQDLLEKCMEAKNKISSLNTFWGPEDYRMPIDFIRMNGDTNMLDQFLQPLLEVGENERYEDKRDRYYAKKARNPRYLLELVDSGMVGEMAFGAQVRKVQMTRGNKQGNNAFLEFKDNGTVSPLNELKNNHFLQRLYQDSSLQIETLTKLSDISPAFESSLYSNISKLIKFGKNLLAHALIQKIVDNNNWGFTQLHLQALNPETDPNGFEEVQAVDVVKKCITNQDLTPLHCACVNGNEKVLLKLLEINKEVNITDKEFWRPVHYAAVCEATGPLSLLIEAGAKLDVKDNQQRTCLHVASMAGRAASISMILEKCEAPSILLEQKDSDAMDALAYACKNGHYEAVEVLIKLGAKVNSRCGSLKMPVLSYAACNGHYKVCELLIDNKARVLGKDKYQRTPLIMAVRNGYAKIASLLLQRGSEWNHNDSSQNTPMHYAAAYGWSQCLELLLEAGGDLNAYNTWRMTPISIAMLKSHMGCVKKILEQPYVDVNCKDEKGRTLLMLALSNITEETPDFIQFLMEKGADPNLLDGNGQSPLHHIAKYVPNVDDYIVDEVDVDLEEDEEDEEEENSAKGGEKEEVKKELDELAEDEDDYIEFRRKTLMGSKGIKQSGAYFRSQAEIDKLQEEKKQEENADRNLMREEQIKQRQKEKLEAVQLEICRLFIEYEGDLTKQNDEGESTFSICLFNNNTSMMKMLSSTNALKNHDLLLFDFNTKILNIEYQKIILMLIENLKPDKNQMNALNEIGHTPFLSYLDYYTSNAQNMYNEIRRGIMNQGHNYLDKTNKLDKEALKAAMKNSALFDDKTPWKQHQKYNNFDGKLVNEITQEIFENIITEPFIEFLGQLIDAGADPTIKVQKPKVHRDKELERKLKIERLENRLETEKQLEDKPKKRRKILAKIQSLKEAQEAASKNMNEYGADGLRNAFHIVLKYPDYKLVEFLLMAKVDPDDEDKLGDTPFNIVAMEKNQRFASVEHYNALKENLILQKVRIDHPDSRGRTPFLHYFEKNDFDSAQDMLKLGANIDQIDKQGNFALKTSVLRDNFQQTQKLITAGANINQEDHTDRNVLHHLLNLSNDGTPFVTAEYLIENRIDINRKDKRGRTPLHYIFVKQNSFQQNNHINPIEMLRNLCECKGIKLDEPDHWLKTPLHYAAQRNSIICSVYLINRGANYQSKDIYGNTPLGIAIQNRHFNYSILMLEKYLPNIVPVYVEDHGSLNRMETLRKELKELEKDDIKMDIDEGDRGQEEEKKGKKSNQKSKSSGKSSQGGKQVSKKEEKERSAFQDESELSSVSSDEDLELSHEQFKPALQVANPFTMKRTAEDITEELETIKKRMAENVNSMFKLALRHNERGLYYLILDKGYNIIEALQDAMEENWFALVIGLLKNYPGDKKIQECNKKGQNLLHLLSMKSKSCSVQDTKTIYEVLKKRGVNCQKVDNLKRTALHYAVMNQSFNMVHMLLEESDDKMNNINLIDANGESPLSFLLKGSFVSGDFGTQFLLKFKMTVENDIVLAEQVATWRAFFSKFEGIGLLHEKIYGQLTAVQINYRQATFGNQFFQHRQQDNIFNLLIKHGSDVNVLYPENSYKPAFSKEEVKDKKYDPEGNYLCTPLINLVRKVNKLDNNAKANMEVLFLLGARLDVVDSDGRDAIMHAVMANKSKLVQYLLDKEDHHLNISTQDKKGKSVGHYIVCPLRFGSYENTKLLRRLHKFGYDLNIADHADRTPFSYAQEQESGVMMNEFMKIKGISESDFLRLQRNPSIVFSQNWPESKVDYESDSVSLLDEAKQKAEENFQAQAIKYPVDHTGRFGASYEVFVDEREQPWTVYMTKVDLQKGLYGEYLFYTMQLLFEKNQELYIVFTRWGRIGEDGMNQRSPFNSVEQAKAEYKKIFAQKTGGNNFENLEAFEKTPGKYSVVKRNYSAVSQEELLSPYNYSQLPETSLPEATYKLLQEVANVTLYQRAMKNCGINRNFFPLSNISKELILEARQILMQIKDAVDEDLERQKQFVQTDYNALVKIKEKIFDLSNRYYELIPLSKYTNAVPMPLRNYHEIQEQYETLQSLTNIEFASKILLGAKYRSSEMNPIDYVYESLNLMIDPLAPSSGEYEVINRYIQNTNTNYRHRIQNIFKIQRKGEAEVMQTFKLIPRHYLLYHGSSIFNFIGILAQGLRIAPPEAPPTGYMFGKGVYFADMFDKSAPYANRGNLQSNSFLMLLCEVALGNSKELYHSQYIEKLEGEYLSAHGLGQRGPNYKHSVILPNGVTVPLGETINYQDQENKNQKGMFGGGGFGQRQYRTLSHNEYIVYNTQQIRMRYLIQVST